MRWPSLGSSPLEVGLLRSKGPSIASVSGLCSQHLIVVLNVSLSPFSSLDGGDRRACAHRALKHFHVGLPICPSQNTPASALSKQRGEVVSGHASARFTEVTDPELT